MHRFRHLAALILAAVLVQGTALRSGAPCVVDGAPAPAAGLAATTAEHDHSAMDRRSPAEQARAHDHVPGEHAPAHCVMAMSCVTTALVASTATSVAPLAADGGSVAALDDDLPQSAGAALEPPPPRG